MIKLSHVLIVDSSHHDMFKYTMTTTSASSLLSLHNSTPAIPSLPLLVSSSIDNPSPRYDLCAYSSSGRTSIRPARQRRMIIYDPIIFMVSILLLLNCVIEPTIAHYSPKDHPNEDSGLATKPIRSRYEEIATSSSNHLGRSRRLVMLGVHGRMIHSNNNHNGNEDHNNKDDDKNNINKNKHTYKKSNSDYVDLDDDNDDDDDDDDDESIHGVRALVGSSPPKCVKKCGTCSPCRSVLVPIHTSLSSAPTQYYPEAWRCQCKGHLYTP